MDATGCDILILGGGPAGISAALTAHARGRSVTVISNAPSTSALWKAPAIENYPGLPGVTGRALMEAMTGQLSAAGVAVITGRVTALMPMGKSFMASVGQDVYTARAVVLAAGAAQSTGYPGEAEHLGRGVSYCTTCDGMLYRGKKVAVIGLSAQAPEEAAFLQSIGCDVEYFDKSRAKKYEIHGGDAVTALVADGVRYPVAGVFILRDTVAASVLLPGLTLAEGHIAVDGQMKTSIPGVFAAGDCTGRPHQLARAVGQGNIAALSADAYIKENDS